MIICGPYTVHVFTAQISQAGLLTYGSSYQLHLPNEQKVVSGDVAAFVPDYSGGPVPDSNGVPSSARYEHLNFYSRKYQKQWFVKPFHPPLAEGLFLIYNHLGLWYGW